MAKKSKVKAVIEAKLCQVAAERDRLDAVADALRETLRELQETKAAPKRPKVSAVRKATVEKFNETAAKAAERPKISPEREKELSATRQAVIDKLNAEGKQ